MIADETWELIIGMILSNFDKIDEALATGRYGMAAHYDSKNVALIEVLEASAPKLLKAKVKKLGKTATTRQRFDALKK